MKQLYLTLGTLFMLSAIALPIFSQVSNDNEDEVYKIDARAGQNDFVPGQVLVKFKGESPVNVNRARGQFRSVNNSAVDAVLKEFGVDAMDKLLPDAKPLQVRRKTGAFNGKEVEEKDLSQLYTIQMKSARKDSTMMLVSKLKEIGDVEYAEPNYKIYMMGQVSNPVPQGYAKSVVRTRVSSIEMVGDVICANPGQNPLYAEQWGIKHLHIDELWNKPVINKKRPVIAVLDTGVDITHPDLADNIWTKPGTEDEHGYDFINDTYDIRDYNMHGTHVAGIAAACNNETGIVGANPQALIMPVTVMQSDGTGDIQVLIKGIHYAMDNGADVINMSLGTYAYSQALREVLMTAYQNSVLVAASGNDYWPLRECLNKIEPTTMYPAAFPFVLGVQANLKEFDTKRNTWLAEFSNYDCNGPTYSEFKLNDAENYELMAPGTNIISTIPYGKYKSLNGTSMSSPLVAGAISALKMVKEYNSQEILWGDLIHTDCNFLSVYNIIERKPELEITTLIWDDSNEGNGDGHYDAGETVRISPVIRTIWGEANNIKLKLEIGDYEDESLVDFIQNNVDFGWNLSAFANETSKNPLILKIHDDCPDGRHIKLRLVATCEGAINSPVIQDFVLVVDNVIKLHGLQNEDLTLSPNHKYLVSGDYVVVEGSTLTIEPGTNLMFREGVSFTTYGKLIANGEPGKMITFKRHEGDGGPYTIILDKDTISYCYIEGAEDTYEYAPRSAGINLHKRDDWRYPSSQLKNCYIRSCWITDNYSSKDVINCTITGSKFLDDRIFYRTNIVNNIYHAFNWSKLAQNNCFNNVITQDNEDDNFYYNYFILDYSGAVEPSIMTNDDPSYLGSSREDIIRPHIKDMNYGDGVGNGYGVVDISNMLKEPIHDVHGIVWKVLVDGIDPQDEFEKTSPLGVGKHKFEVYFNRPMNKKVTPNIAFGVRFPYSQNAVDEEGSWNEEGTIYTAYKTITGKTQSDGRNRIYVWGAEDDEFFECPYENFRFNIDIQSAGSQSTGFMGEAGLGRVELDWENVEVNAEDILGYNIYRYITTPDDSIRVNEITIDANDKHFTDYDIKPGTTYYYKYKAQNTDLKEFLTSNVVAVTPKTAKLGDVTGNNEVDVFDVVYEVNYILGQKPKQFVKCAADVNEDNSIDILDVQGIIGKILDPSTAAARTKSGEISAIYSIEDGILYVESPVALGGIQVQINVPEPTEITATDELKGFEQAGSWLSKNDYLFLAYSMNGKTLSAGKHALLKIGNGQVTNIILGDATAKRVQAIPAGDVTKVEALGSAVRLQKGVYNLKGQKVAGSTKEFDKLPKGVYIIEGVKVVK